MLAGRESWMMVLQVSEPQVSVLALLQFILYSWEIFEPMDNRLYDYTDDSTLLAVVRKPADRPNVAASLNKDLDTSMERWNHWGMMLNPNKTKALDIRRSWTVNTNSLFWLELVSGFNLRYSQPWQPWREVSQQALVRRPHSWYCFSCLSRNWYFEVGEECLSGHLCVTFLLLCICFSKVWVLFSSVGFSSRLSASASRAPGVFGGQALPWSEFLLIYHRRPVAGMRLLYKIT